MGQAEFERLVMDITAGIAGKPLDGTLAQELNGTQGPGSAAYDDLAAACRTGVAEGWLANREHGGIKFGRVIKPGPDTAGFSVDVVEMTDVKGPHHAHPNGEIDFIVPIDETAEFDGQGAGWCVYGPGTAHHPTVTGGKAIVLYLLPEGAIDFTGK